MKKNKGKGLVDEETIQETHFQPHPVAGDKRKNLFRTVDLGSLPSRRNHKKSKHGSSKSGFIKPGFVVHLASAKPLFAQVLNLDSSSLVKVTPSKPIETTLSKPPSSIPMTLLENEDLEWEKFQQVVNDEGIDVCYDMSLKEFEHSAVHDLFKVHIFFFFFWHLESSILNILVHSSFQPIWLVGYAKFHGSIGVARVRVGGKGS